MRKHYEHVPNPNIVCQKSLFFSRTKYGLGNVTYIYIYLFNNSAEHIEHKKIFWKYLRKSCDTITSTSLSLMIFDWLCMCLFVCFRLSFVGLDCINRFIFIIHTLYLREMTIVFKSTTSRRIVHRFLFVLSNSFRVFPSSGSVCSVPIFDAKFICCSFKFGIIIIILCFVSEI